MKFPKNFLWGAATSAHQVEGNNRNDWSEWEKENADRLSRESNGKYPPENYISGRACDHYNRFREDFDMARSLGHNAHRFSIEWSRIQPMEGVWVQKEVEHYREVVSELKKHGMEPVVTLSHWTIPIWLSNKGGWKNKESIEYFSTYAQRMVKEYPDVKFWITFNETNVSLSHGYFKGDWPPGKRSFIKFLVADHNMANAHRQAYKMMKRANPNLEIGVTELFIYFSRSKLKSFFWNYSFLRSIYDELDFIGVDYYFSDRNTKERSEFLNWPIDPEGIYWVLKDLQKYHLPIFIMENGIADANDTKREKFITEHLEWISKAIQIGVDVRGYFYWSLLDNFEWDKGFWPRFGLVEIDYKTMERKIRPSAWKYKEIIEKSR